MMMLDSKIPPHDDEAERATLGALILDNNTIDTALQYLRPDSFYSGANKRIFQAIIDLFNQGHTPDILTVKDKLTQTGELEQSGGATYVASLTSVVPSTANIEYYAKIVLDRSIRRSLFYTAHQIIKDIFDETIGYQDLLERVQKKLFELIDDSQSYTIKSLKDIVPGIINEVIERSKSGEMLTGIPSGFEKLDEMTAGFQHSDFVVIGARTSVGKTALALSMAAYITVKKHIPAAFFSLEMTDAALVRRLLAGEARVDAKRIKTGFLKTSDFPKLAEGAAILYEAPLYIMASPNMPLLDLRAQARRLRLQQKVEIIFIDYLTLITPENAKREQWQQFAEISKSLKSLARELNIPIVALSQLNRETNEKEPQLSNIRASGAIEQDADLVIFLEREKGAMDAKLNIAKQRDGETGKIDIVFLPEYTRFENLEKERGSYV
jgi:replicative DNA helicase